MALFKYLSVTDTFQRYITLISDKNINQDPSWYPMDGSRLPHLRNTLFLLFTLTVLLPGCIRETETLSSPCEIPCASDMTRYLTARVNPNSSICLIVVKGTSSRAAMYVITQCPFLVGEAVSDEDFRFYPLPPGDYVAMLPHEAFSRSQNNQASGGYDLFNSSLRINICGGEMNH